MSSVSSRRATVGQTYALLADLPLRIESWATEPLSRQMAPGRTRHTAVIRPCGDGQEGVGEDITPGEPDHPEVALHGDWTIDSFTRHLAAIDLFGGRPPHPMLRSFRRWAFESAALDLALRQAGRSLSIVVGRPPRPVTFVNSLRLPDPPTFEPIRDRLGLFPDLRFKLEPTAAWDEDLIAELAATGAVDTLDLKGQYPPESSAGQPPDARLYARIVRGFPDSWLEDPAITPDTRKVLEPHRERITWDAPLRSLADVERLATPGAAVNIKPVRFGTVRTLLDVYDHCIANGIRMYGGGFDELGPGRHQIQYLASLFHPDTANDVAPIGYNESALAPTLHTSPLTPQPGPTGFRWGWSATGTSPRTPPPARP